MAKTKGKASAPDAWDSGELGREEKYVAVAPESSELELQEALGLQMISIRLQKQLIESLKTIAEHHGVGYQPLIRDILKRFVIHEQKKIIRDLQDSFETMKSQQKALEHLRVDAPLLKADPEPVKAKKAA